MKRVILFVIAIFGVQIASWIRLRAASQGGTRQEAGRQGQKSIAALPTTVDPAPKAVVSKKSTEPIAPKDKEQGETLTRITAMPPVSVADKSKSLWDYLFD
jgi:hypothetical protein